MATLTPAQFAIIADAITDAGAAVDSYLNNHVVPEPARSKLNSLQSTLTNLGANWEQTAIQADYADSADAFAKLSAAAAAANQAAADLTNQVANISKAAGVIGALAGLAAKLAQGAAIPIVAAAVAVASAAS